MKYIYGLITMSMIFTQSAFAEVTSAEVVKNIQGVCLAPGQQGERWDVKVQASGDVKVGLKLAGRAGVDANVDFTKSQWEGVQQVLREQQQKDNANYRECAKNIAPLFINKINKENSNDLANPPSANNDLKLPINVVGGGTRVVFSPDFAITFEKMLGGGDPRETYITINTPENGRMELTEGIPVNVSIKGKNYLLQFKLNKFDQPVYTLTK